MERCKARDDKTVSVSRNQFFSEAGETTQSCYRDYRGMAEVVEAKVCMTRAIQSDIYIAALCLHSLCSVHAVPG